MKLNDTVTIYYLHFLQNSAESPACRLPTAHPSPILSPISLNISLLYILIFSAAATKRKLNELKPMKYKGPQLCLWDEGVCGLLQLPHEKIVLVTSPDAAVCRAAAVSPRLQRGSPPSLQLRGMESVHFRLLRLVAVDSSG